MQITGRVSAIAPDFFNELDTTPTCQIWGQNRVMLKKFFSSLYALHSNINTDVNKSNKNQKKFAWESPQ